MIQQLSKSISKGKNKQNNSKQSPIRKNKVNDLIYQSYVYFSPFKKNTENQLIDEIKSIGDQILQFQDNKKILKSNSNKLINKSSKEKSPGNEYKKLQNKLNQLQNNYKNKQKLNTQARKPKFTNRQQQSSFFTLDLTRSLTKSPEKSKLKENQQQERFQKNTLYDKYKNHHKKTELKNLQSKKQEIKQNLQQIQMSKQKINQRLKTQTVKPRYLDPKSQLNYAKFINKNIKKIVKENQQCQKATKFYKQDQSITHKSLFDSPQKFINVYDPKKRTYVKQFKTIKANEDLVNQSFQKVLIKGQQTLKRKQEKIDKLREQINKKEMKNVTFKPKLETKYYEKSKICQKNNNKKQKFQQRLIDDIKSRQYKQKQIILDQMSKSPFKPRLNPSTKQAQSVIKSIWTSHNTSITIAHKSSIQKFKTSHNESTSFSTNLLKVSANSIKQLFQ